MRLGIEDAGFVECTPIQASTLPLALAGQDIAGQAQTGTGKTAAFLIATFNRLVRTPRRKRPAWCAPRALMIAPTRELAVQIKKDADLLGRHCGLEMHAVFGGVDYNKQLERLKEGVDILIGTPGRLIDYFKQKAYGLEAVEVLVIDEADRMFDMGFIDDIRYMLRRLPPPDRRQSFLYSATLSHRVLELAFEHMNEVERVAISENQVTADNVEQIVYHVGQDEKLRVLLGVMAKERPSRTLVFVNTRSGASWLADRLCAQGHDAGALAGDLDQRKRLRLLDRFKQGDLPILVATDVASRGLHIERVSHVFNYDLPQDPEDYVHRIGRTARAGASGRAISLACETWVYSLEAIEEYIGYKLPTTFPDESVLAKLAPMKRYERPVRPGGAGPSRGGGQGRGGGGRGGGGRGRKSSAGAGGGRGKPMSAKAPSSDAGGAAVDGAAPGEGSAPERKRRSRRRRRKGAETVATAPE